jgi:hypothetical protein
VEAKILDADGEVLALGKGLFIEVQPRREALAVKDETSASG